MTISNQVCDMDIVPGPEVKNITNEKRLKKVVKMGGKRGVEIEGAADMGGLQFFCSKFEEATGDLNYLIEAVKAMNAVSDPTEEERKGGSGKVGKMIFSFSDDKLALVCYVPKNKSKECNAFEWLTYIVKHAGDLDNIVTSFDDIPSENWAVCEIQRDTDKGIFPIKIRDPCISHAYTFLRQRGLFPEDEESDDEYCWGDEDFPDAYGEEEVVEKLEEGDEKVEEKVEEEEEVVEEKVEVEEEDVIVSGPSTPENLKEKRLKKIVKMGGKRGVEIEGAADMGGLQFFCSKFEEAEGDLTYLIEAVKAMNTKSDPSEEERKGGAGKVGKMIFSYSDNKLSLVCYVPKNKSKECNALEWLTYIVKNAGGPDGIVKLIDDIPSENWAVCEILRDVEKNIFPIKIRDPCISHAYTFLRQRNLFPEDEESDDDYCWGDEDFPEC